MSMVSKRLPRSSRGSILLIGLLLFGSAAIRLGLEAGQAVATESPFEITRNTPNSTPVIKKDRTELSNLLSAFQEREARIQKSEQEIQLKRRALEVADEEIDRRLKVLEEAEISLRSLLAIADTAAEDDLTTLTSVYENMKPKDAAPLFEQMEPAFAAGFLGRMRPDAAAAIMSGLTPEKAYTISVILAGRNAKAPKG